MAFNPDKEAVIKTEASQTITDIEACYQTLVAHPGHDLLLPTKLKGKTLGTYASLIQFIGTWARNSSGKLRTYITDQPSAV
jgi:hypothetical protein